MKKILIATDFSENATNAAVYGYHLATHLKANIILCNAVIVPAEVPQAGMVVWPMEETDILTDASTAELIKLRDDLEQQHATSNFFPEITCLMESGILTEVISHITTGTHIDMIVMATHGGDGLSAFLLGDHSRRMISSTKTKLLLVPEGAKFTPIKKIAFAADFKGLDENLTAIYDLIPFAKLFNAEILAAHIYHEMGHSDNFNKWIRDFLTELSNRANYPNIYYRIIKNSRTDAGLDWLCEHGQVDILAMLHNHHDFLDHLLNGSHTEKMAEHTRIPLLVIPAKS